MSAERMINGMHDRFESGIRQNAKDFVREDTAAGFVGTAVGEGAASAYLWVTGQPQPPGGDDFAIFGGGGDPTGMPGLDRGRRGSSGTVGVAKPDMPTSRAARREAMRKRNTPTSRSATSQRQGKNGRRQTVVEGQDGKPVVQTEHGKDKNHDFDHWHDGDPKIDPETGDMRTNRHGQIKDKNEGRSTSTFGDSDDLPD
jgi:hypothetical protein